MRTGSQNALEGEYAPGFEVYLQWDSVKPEALRRLRGVDLSSVRQRALEALNRAQLSTTLVMTVARGVNDEEIGSVIEFAAQQPCVRGVTLQPVQNAGRTESYDPREQRLTLTEVRQRIFSIRRNLFTGAGHHPRALQSRGRRAGDGVWPSSGTAVLSTP